MKEKSSCWYRIFRGSSGGMMEAIFISMKLSCFCLFILTPGVGFGCNVKSICGRNQ